MLFSFFFVCLLGLGTTEIIGIAIGTGLGVIIIALIVVSILFIMYRRKAKRTAFQRKCWWINNTGMDLI